MQTVVDQESFMEQTEHQLCLEGRHSLLSCAVAERWQVRWWFYRESMGRNLEYL